MYFNEMYKKHVSQFMPFKERTLKNFLRMSTQVPWPLIGGLVGVFAVILMIGACYVAYAAWKKKREGPEVRYCHKTNTKIIPPAPSSEPKIVKGPFITVTFCFLIPFSGDIEDAAEALLARKKEGPSHCDECNCTDEKV
jgi:hypothetical protein